MDIHERISNGEFVSKLDYKTNKVAYRADQRRLHDEFQKELEKECDVVGHPLASRVFALAWEHGHSSGLSEVANHYDDFVQLIAPLEVTIKPDGVGGVIAMFASDERTGIGETSVAPALRALLLKHKVVKLVKK